MKHALIFFFSQGGHTLQMAKRLEQTLTARQFSVTLTDITAWKGGAFPAADAVFFCSPLYYQTEPLVWRQFMKSLPPFQGQPAWLVATYADESTDKDPAALMAQNFAHFLRAVRLNPAGHTGVVCADSAHFLKEYAFAHGRPNHDDLILFDRKVQVWLEELLKGQTSPASYTELRKPRKTGILMAAMPKIRVRHDQCTRCGVCVKTCPTGHLTLQNRIVTGKSCMKCYFCETACPSQAIAPHWMVPKMLIRVAMGKPPSAKKA